jgi:hypothetical protein
LEIIISHKSLTNLVVTAPLWQEPESYVFVAQTRPIAGSELKRKLTYVRDVTFIEHIYADSNVGSFQVRTTSLDIRSTANTEYLQSLLHQFTTKRCLKVMQII